jgi:glutaredoxin
MTKKYLPSLLFLVFSMVLVGCSFGGASPKNEAKPAEDNSAIILFYGTECPHCQEVERYLNENKISEKVQFSQREIFHDQANSALLVEKAKSCNVNLDNLGVPFLWSEGQCIMGQQEIIQFFQNKINANQ